MIEQKSVNIELKRIIRNTKKMEEDFIKNNLDLNKNKFTESTDIDGNKTIFISSKTQEQVINKILAATTKSVMESVVYDNTDNSISRAKRIYSRKKENLKIISTIFKNGGHMVKYFKYVTQSGNVSAPTVTEKRIRCFIDRLRNAYRAAEVFHEDGKRMIIIPLEFRETMVKLNIYNSLDYIIEDFQNKDKRELENA